MVYDNIKVIYQKASENLSVVFDGYTTRINFGNGCLEIFCTTIHTIQTEGDLVLSFYINGRTINLEGS